MNYYWLVTIKRCKYFVTFIRTSGFRLKEKLEKGSWFLWILMYFSKQKSIFFYLFTAVYSMFHQKSGPKIEKTLKTTKNAVGEQRPWDQKIIFFIDYVKRSVSHVSILFARISNTTTLLSSVDVECILYTIDWENKICNRSSLLVPKWRVNTK